MKQRLLSLMAIACAMFTSTGAFAQTVLPDPVKPEKPVREAFNGTWVTPADGGTYYIYNVAAVQFMGAGRDWGTRTVVTTDSIVAPNGSKVTVAANKNYAVPFKIEADPQTTYFFIHTLNTSKGDGAYVSGDGNNSWSDYSKDNTKCRWQLIPVEAGFMLHNASEQPYDPTADVNDNDVIDLWRMLGVCAVEQGTYTWNDLKVGGFNDAGESHKIVWKFVEATDEVAANIRQWREDTKAALEEATQAYEAELAFYNAKLALKATIAEAEAAEIEDVNVAIAVYNKADATLEEVQKQNNHLQAEMAGLKYKDISEFNIATDDNPQDVTEYVLINPTFDANIDGWTITVGGQNLKWQGRTDGVVNEDNNWVSITNFIEAWNGTPLGDGTISQTVYGLPKGKYVLECDAMAVRQGGLNGLSEEDAVENAFIFIQGETEVRTPIKAPNAQPKHWSVVFISYGDDALTFGLKVEKTTANWISADNFKLTFYGETTKTQAQLDLEAAIADAEPFLESLTDKYLNAVIKAAYQKAFNDANDVLADGTDEDCIAAKQALEEKATAVNNSIEAYKVLLTYLDRPSEGGKNLLGIYYNIADNCGMTELTEKWEPWMDTWDEAYENGTMTDEEINEKTATIYIDLKEAWLTVNPESIKVGTDLTWLIENADFEEGGVYTAGSSNTIPGWTIAEGDITRKDHVIEAYHRVLNFKQTIPNMPAGVYDVTVQGFVRHDDGDAVNDGKGTIFYGGDTKAMLMQRSDQWHATGFYTGAAMGDPCGGNNADQDITNINNETVKVPNGMSGFYFWEDEENTEGETMVYTGWKKGDKYYTNHVKVILKEAGDFTIGLQCLNTHDWVIWDNFGLTYLGQDASLYDDMVEDKFKELDNIYDPEKIFITKGGKDLYDQLKSDIAKDKGTLNAETEAAYESRIDEVIAYLNDGHKLALGLRDDLSDYEEIRLENMDLASPDNNNFIDWVGNLVKKFPPTDDYGMLTADELKDNETIQATTNDMNRRMADYVMQFAEENQYDETDGTMYGNATEAIFNARFIKYDATDQTTRGWTLEVADSLQGKAIGLGYNNAEMFNCSNFKISQTVRGLYPGWYLLTVDAFYRPGDYATIKTADDMQKKYVVMFAESGELQDEKALKNIMEGAQANKIAASDEVEVTVDEKKYWIPNMMVSAATYLHQEVGHLVGEEEVFNYIAVTMDESDGVYNSIYRNGMLVEVDESGEMTIGLRKDDNWVPNDWTIFGNWTLTYFGDEENIPTAVETVEAKSAKNMIMDIFTIDGRQAQRLQRGINIVRTTDGKLHKVLVK